jgi:hypothetical protein
VKAEPQVPHGAALPENLGEVHTRREIFKFFFEPEAERGTDPDRALVQLEDEEGGAEGRMTLEECGAFAALAVRMFRRMQQAALRKRAARQSATSAAPTSPPPAASTPEAK